MELSLPDIGVVNKVEGFEKVYALNGFEKNRDLLNMRLYKYRKIEDFEASVKSKELVFVSPVLWKDRYERRFLFTDYSKCNFVQNKIRCMCFTTEGAVNEEAGWKCYSDDKNEKCVRLTFKVDKLLHALDKYAIENKAKIYIGEAIYGLDVNEIYSVHKSDSRYNSIFFPKNFNVSNYLSLMLLKRKAFAYENEIRIFIYHEKEIFSEEEKKFVDKENIANKAFLLDKVTVDYKSILSEVRLSPNIESNTELEEIKNKLSKIFKGTINASRLYSSGWQLKKI